MGKSSTRSIVTTISQSHPRHGQIGTLTSQTSPGRADGFDWNDSSLTRDVETETVTVDAHHRRKLLRALNFRSRLRKGRKQLVAGNRRKEKNSLPGGIRKRSTRHFEFPDVNGKLQLVQRGNREAKEDSNDVEGRPGTNGDDFPYGSNGRPGSGQERWKERAGKRGSLIQTVGISKKTTLLARCPETGK